MQAARLRGVHPAGLEAMLLQEISVKEHAVLFMSQEHFSWEAAYSVFKGMAWL